MQSILLIGRTGQLGYELERCLAPLGSLHAVDQPQVDLAQPANLIRLMRSLRPAVVINAAAYTAVDRAEDEAELAWKVNAAAPGAMAEAARQLGAAFVHFSTDYVFDGLKGASYSESDTPNPLGVYGSTKLAGEQAVQQIGGAFLILRTAWLYSLRVDSFVTKVLDWAHQEHTIRLVTDQVSSPTWARMLAEITALTLASAGKNTYGWLKEHAGVYHLAGSGSASRFEWGKAILACGSKPDGQKAIEILPALSNDFPSRARRPKFSALDCSHFQDTFGFHLPPWQDALKLAFQS